jgi:hypothetical protein
VVEKRPSIEVEGKQYFTSKECDPIIGPQLKAFAGQEVEVLMANGTRKRRVQKLNSTVGKREKGGWKDEGISSSERT